MLTTRFDIPGGGVNVTPDDSTDLTTPGTLFIGTGGDLKVTLVDGSVLTYKNLPDGSDFPRLVKRVWSTGTTASNIIVEYPLT